MTIARHYTGGGEVTAFDIERVQDTGSEQLRTLAAKPHISDAVLIEGVDLIGGDENWVLHGLGRTIRGWWVADQTASGAIWRVSTSSADLTKYLPLGAVSTATVSLVVF